MREVLDGVGHCYLRLSISLNTLSGVESQWLKLVRHLAESKTAADVEGNGDGARGNLFIFDEPTTGLHFDDVAMLLRVFQHMVDRGNSIIVNEHNQGYINFDD